MAIIKHFFFIILMTASEISTAQPVLSFRNDLAFDARTVDTAADRIYRRRMDKLAADGLLDSTPELLKRVHYVLGRLLAAAQYERPDAALIGWEIHICRRCDEKASAMAGGKMLVGEEFIADFDLSDDELAYVLAHEIAHVLAEHPREFATIARFFISNGQKRGYRDIQNELDESIIANLRMAPEYKQQELEADYMGFILGARSKFDPEAMLTMLRKLRVPVSSAFALHPNEAERMQQAQSMLHLAYRIHEIGVTAP